MKLLRYLILIGLIIGLGSVWSGDAWARTGYLGIYERTQKNYDKLFTKNWKHRATAYSGYTPKELQEITENGDLSKLKLAGNNSAEGLSSALVYVSQVYDRESQIARLETSLYLQNNEVGLYANGRTDDSPFDLIADLNIIDFILFGSNLELPVADWSLFKDTDNTLSDDSEDMEQDLPTADVTTVPPPSAQDTLIDLTELDQLNPSSYNNRCDFVPPPTPYTPTGAAPCQQACSANAPCPEDYTCAENGFCTNRSCDSANTNVTTTTDLPKEKKRFCNDIVCIKVSIIKTQHNLLALYDNSIAAHTAAIRKALVELDNQDLSLNKKTKQAFDSPFMGSINFGDNVRMKVVFEKKSMYNVDNAKLKKSERETNRAIDDVNKRDQIKEQQQDEMTFGKMCNQMFGNSLNQESTPLPADTDPTTTALYLAQKMCTEYSSVDLTSTMSKLTVNNEYFSAILEQILTFRNNVQGLLDVFIAGKNSLKNTLESLNQTPQI